MASGPKCSNSKCRKSDFAVKELNTGTFAYKAGIVYCTACGKIVGLVSG